MFDIVIANAGILLRSGDFFTQTRPSAIFSCVDAGEPGRVRLFPVPLGGQRNAVVMAGSILVSRPPFMGHPGHYYDFMVICCAGAGKCWLKI